MLTAIIGSVALVSSWLTFAFQQRTTRQAVAKDRQEQRQREFLNAIEAYASAVNQLRRAERNRAKKRFSDAPKEVRDDARQDTYRLRAEAGSAYYRLRLRADPRIDNGLLQNAESIIELTREISAYTATETAMEERGVKAKNALDEFMEGIREKYSS